MSALHRDQHVKYILTGLKNIQARFEVILKPFVYSDCICSVISCVLKNRHKKNTPDHQRTIIKLKGRFRTQVFTLRKIGHSFLSLWIHMDLCFAIGCCILCIY